MQELKAEMVANVWKHVASVGDAIEVGGTVMILESMKMEIPVVAEEAGIVASIDVAEGTVVQEGDVVATINEAS